MININMHSTFSFGQGVTNIIMLKCNLAFLKEALRKVGCLVVCRAPVEPISKRLLEDLKQHTTFCMQICLSGLAVLSFKLRFRTNLEYQYQNPVV